VESIVKEDPLQSADAGENVNQETDTAQHKPVLNQEGFQRLLAAAYLLQVHNDGRPSIRSAQHAANHASSFAAGTIVQERTPSLMIQERQLQAAQCEAVLCEEVARLQPHRLAPSVGPAFPYRMNVLLRRSMSWRTTEPVAIAIVFFMMMGLSIHRLSAVSGRTSLASGTEEQNERARPTEKVLASSPSVVARNSRQSPGEGEADIVAQDIVIRHQKLLVNLPSKPGVRLVFGPGAAADTVVQYGSDVKMWSRTPERATLNRLEH
jgi:hypothetical protein